MLKDDVFCTDLAAYCSCKPDKPPHWAPEPPHGCEDFCYPPGYYWVPMPHEHKPVDYPHPHPHPHKHDCDCDCCKPKDEEIDVKKSSTEGQICKLSKKAAALNRLLANMNEKKKDVIIKIGDTSFNFGNVDAEYSGWDEDGEKSYAATVKKIIEHQRGLIMAKIKELADTLDDEAEGATGVEDAVTGD